MDLLALETRIAGSVNMDLSDSAEKALIDGWINEAVEQFLGETGVYRAVDTMDTTADEDDYTLPLAVIAMKHLIVSSNGEEIPLEPLNEFDLLTRRRTNSTGTYPTHYALSGANLLRLWPSPASVMTLILDFVPYPTSALAISTDDPSSVTHGGVPTLLHPALEAYGKWKACEFDDDLSSKEGEVFKAEWDTGVAKARARINRMRGRWAPARPGRRQLFPVSRGVDRGF